MAREHQMIEHGAIQRFGSGREPAGRAAIGIAWPRVAARVIVREHNARAAMLSGIDDNGPQREGCTRFVPRIAREMDAPGLVIDMCDPQILTRGIGVRHAAGKEFPGRHQTIELQREFGTLIPHRRELRRSGGSRLFEPYPEWRLIRRATADV